MSDNFHGKPCYYCGKSINSFAANPGRWAVGLDHADEPGVVKPHCIDCVSLRLHERDEALARAEESIKVIDGIIKRQIEHTMRAEKERNEAHAARIEARAELETRLTASGVKRFSRETKPSRNSRRCRVDTSRWNSTGSFTRTPNRTVRFVVTCTSTTRSRRTTIDWKPR
jgi:hypothetical protein